MAKEAEWAKRVAAWQKSGLRAEAFVKGKDYRAKTLVWWSSELRRRARRRSEPKSASLAQSKGNIRLARAVLKTTRSKALLVRVGSAEVVVERGFDGELLSEVVQALGGTR